MMEQATAIRQEPRYNTWWGNLFGRIWASWAAISFITTMLIFMIPFLLFCYFLPDPKKTKRFILYSRTWMQVFLTSIGCPLKVIGRENFKNNNAYIVVCNHNALMDVPVSSPGIPGGNKTIAKIEFVKIPVFGLLYKTGSVIVDRKSEQSRRDSFAKMKNVLEMGLHMCIYPEGTRNKTNEPLKQFHNGAFKLAMDTGHRIIPALIFNSRKVMPSYKTFFIWPHRLYLQFLPAVDFLPMDTPDTLKERVFNIMKEHYTSHINQYQ